MVIFRWEHYDAEHFDLVPYKDTLAFEQYVALSHV